MAIRVTDKDGKTIRFEAFLVDRMVDMTKVTDVSELDGDSVLFFTKETVGEQTTMTAQHWSLPGEGEACKKIHALATKWLAINEAEAAKMSTLTEADHNTLDACQNGEAWRAACNTVKDRHGGVYPSDWHAIIIQGGRGDEILARWGMDTSIKEVHVPAGQTFEEAQAALTQDAHPTVQCKGCDKFPDQISEFVEMAAEEPKHYRTPTAAAKTDGTYNRGTGKFWCTVCYIEAGQPPGTA